MKENKKPDPLSMANTIASAVEKAYHKAKGMKRPKPDASMDDQDENADTSGSDQAVLPEAQRKAQQKSKPQPKGNATRSGPTGTPAGRTTKNQSNS